MAIQRDSDYPGRWGAADADYPGGIPKNRTTPTSADGSYLEEKLWKDQYGFQDAAISQGNITRSGNPETATASDVLDGIKSVVAGQALTWSATRNYNHPVIVSGSDDELYASVQDSGPDSTVQDPTTDVSDTYWQLLSDSLDITDSFSTQLLHIREEQAAGVNGPTTSGGGAYDTININTVKTNEIAGASLSANQIVLDAGTYYVEGVVNFTSTANPIHTLKSRLRNITDGATEIVGQSLANADESTKLIPVTGRFTIAGAKTFELQAAMNGITGTSANWGRASNLTEIEVYADVRIWKVS